MEINLLKLTSKEASIRKLDSEIFSLIEPEQIENEINETEAVYEAITETRFQCERNLRDYKERMDEFSLKNVEIKQKRSLVKNPTLELKNFSGNDILDWQEFWDSFKVTFHDDEEMVEIDKFSALRGYLTGDAFDTIRGIRVTEDNYEYSALQSFGLDYR